MECRAWSARGLGEEWIALNALAVGLGLAVFWLLCRNWRPWAWPPTSSLGPAAPNPAR